jgi:hypothetical protein
MFIMPSLRQRFSDYRKTKKRKAQQKKVAAEQRAIDAEAHSANRLELYRLLNEYADSTNSERPRLYIPDSVGGHGKTKRNKKQRKTRNKTRRKRHHKTRHDKPSSPIRHYPPPKHTRLKKLLITALASSPGISPFKSNPLQTGESGVKDIEYDTFKFYGVPKSAYKVGKDYAKSFSRNTKELKPNKIQFLPVVEEPLNILATSRY